MRARDRATIERGVASGAELMERAGQRVAGAIERVFGPVLALRVLVLCGPGNNGGDGFVVARALHQRGANVHAALCAPRERVQGDAAGHLALAEQLGLAVPSLEAATLTALADGPEWDIAVDALLGTGSEGEPRGAIASACDALQRLAARGTRIVAVDLPTGASADRGTLSPHAVPAALTVTFGALKRAHVLWPSRAACGRIECEDIGLVADALPAPEWPTPADIAALLPSRDPRAHKGSVGRVLVVGGAPGTTGAMTLATRAAIRAGAGYVRGAVPASLADVFAAAWVEAMPVACAETDARTLGLASLHLLRGEAAHADAMALGPGLSRHADAAELARALYAECTAPLVLDADGLVAFADAPDALRDAAGPRVLTPHLGELSKLTGETASELEAARIDVAIRCAARWNAVVVVKGAPTVTAAPDGRATVNPTGNPGMATAGAGDVLTGTVAALLAQGLGAYDAARAGVWLHGAAGDRVARERGAIGIAAGDLAEALPVVRAEVGRSA